MSNRTLSPVARDLMELESLFKQQGDVLRHGGYYARGRFCFYGGLALHALGAARDPHELDINDTAHLLHTKNIATRASVSCEAAAVHLHSMCDLMRVNDDHGYSAVLAVIRHAIQTEISKASSTTGDGAKPIGAETDGHK